MGIEVRVPATTANLGPGFDCLGLALGLYNTVEVGAADSGLRIHVEGEGCDLIPADTSNLVYRAIVALFEYVGEPLSGLHIRLSNAIPLMSGLGSSSAAIVGGLVAANAFLGGPLSKDEVLALAVDIEGHPDNVAPALLGGLVVVVNGGEGPIYRQIAIPTLDVIVAVPDFQLATTEARAALPAQVPFADAVYNVGRTALVIQGLSQADYDLLAYAMDDRLHQPYRTPLVPGLADVFETARRAGAAGVALSGAGPSVVAFAPGHYEAIAEAMRGAFARHGLGAQALVLQTTTSGAQVIDKRTGASMDAPV